MVLTTGLISVANNKVYCKLGNGTVRDLTQDNDTVYTHPATKQCNYVPDLSNINATTLQGYTYSQIVANVKSTIKIVSGSLSLTFTSVNLEVSGRISYSGFTQTPALSLFGRSVNTTSSGTFTRPISVYITDINTTGATIAAATTGALGTGQIYWFAIGQ